MENEERLTERYLAARRARRNAALAARLATPRTFDEMLGELRALRGLNERAEDAHFFEITATNV